MARGIEPLSLPLLASDFLTTRRYHRKVLSHRVSRLQFRPRSGWVLTFKSIIPNQCFGMLRTLYDFVLHIGIEPIYSRGHPEPLMCLRRPSNNDKERVATYSEPVCGFCFWVSPTATMQRVSNVYASPFAYYTGLYVPNFTRYSSPERTKLAKEQLFKR